MNRIYFKELVKILTSNNNIKLALADLVSTEHFVLQLLKE